MVNGFPAAVYFLCFATSVVCALMLARSYRRTGVRLLMWSAVCFGLLAVNNFIVIVDMVMIESINFAMHRLWVSFLAVSVLLVGFVWESE